MTSELKPCPFCGGDMKEHVSAFGLPMFKCENRDCGAIVSFDNDLCNIAAARGERGPARMAFNTRAERTCKPELCTNTHPGTVNDYEMDELHCSECDCWLAFEYEELPNYCPNCGAKVVE